MEAREWEEILDNDNSVGDDFAGLGTEVKLVRTIMSLNSTFEIIFFLRLENSNLWDWWQNSVRKTISIIFPKIKKNKQEEMLCVIYPATKITVK